MFNDENLLKEKYNILNVLKYELKYTYVLRSSFPK